VSQTVDLQIVYILSKINSGRNNSDLEKPIRRAVRYILAELPNLLGLDSSHRPQMCLLIPRNGKFSVVAYSGIEHYRLVKIEELFRYSPEPISLAGLAMNHGKPIIVNDLSDRDNEYVGYWIRLTPNEIQPGSLLAYPVIRGIGSIDTEPIAILYITSDRKNAFDVEAVLRLLGIFSPKIEILQRFLDLKQQ
jgi:GAF domain-containing protein